jgi:Protein of unknown function (DUF3109)
MILVQNTVISDDIAEHFFVCNLEKCKGACCVEGDYGAPLEAAELPVLASIYDKVKPFLTPEGIRTIEQLGTHVVDPEGDFATPMIPSGACAYSLRDERGVLKCGIEQAHAAGQTDFRKPISCHLYPIRITSYGDADALNYHRWDICSPACDLGQSLGVELYKFLKTPLIRKYGQAWYDELLRELAEREPPVVG